MNSDQGKTDRDPVIQTSGNHHHRVLVVDDEAAAGKAIGRILEREGFDYTYVASAEQGLAAMEASATPFSLILSDQRMPGMTGTQFLSRAKEISPKTVRYLITGYSELDTIINAVNKGAVQHYISKPWDNDALRRAIREGIRIHEQHLDSDRLFSLAKKQNTKLYELNCELVEDTKQLENKLKNLEQEIKALKTKMSETPESQETDPAEVIAHILAWLQEDGNKNPGMADTLKTHALTVLYDLFSDLALRNGIEMPEVSLGHQQTGGSDA